MNPSKKDLNILKKQTPIYPKSAQTHDIKTTPKTKIKP